MADPGVAFTAVDGEGVRRWFDALTDLYAVVYAEPPYQEGPEQVARFADGLPGEARRTGFTAVTATVGDEFVGAVCGWTMPAGTWWSRTDGPPPEDVKAVDKLAVVEWMVRPDHRGLGLGAGLMQRLLDGRLEAWATLASDPRSAARAIYERAGWQQVGTSTLPWGPPMHLLVLPLR